MTPPPKRKTNGEVAAKFGICARTVSRMRGRSRDAYIAECRELRAKAARLRATGMTWAEIGAALGITTGAARSAAQRGAGAWSDSVPPQPDRDPHTGELFGS